MQGRERLGLRARSISGHIRETYPARLRMKYDGGFIAYVNGQESPPQRPCDSSLELDRHRQPQRPATARIQDHRLAVGGALPTGNNVLAIHGLNDSASSPNFLLVPEFDVAQPSGAKRRTFCFSAPTPGLANSTGLPAHGAVAHLLATVGDLHRILQRVLTSPEPLAQIRFTLDGSEPTVGQRLYTTPLHSRRRGSKPALPRRADPSPIRWGRISLSIQRWGNATRMSHCNFSIRCNRQFPGAVMGIARVRIDRHRCTGRAHRTNAPDFIGRAGLHIRGLVP